MAPLLNDRHRNEQAAMDRRRKTQEPTPYKPTITSTPGGDPRYRIPTIGLNPGAIPGSSPHLSPRWLE